MSINNLNAAHLSINSNPGFWEIGAYKANVQRIRDGSNQLNEFTKLIRERIDLESKYGKSLQTWNQKWATYSERQLPDGCIKTSFDGVLSESKVLAKVHLAIKDRCNDEIIETIGKFKKENYHRYTIRGFKEPKEIEEEFEKAQQRWKKLHQRVETAKKYYYSCRRGEKSAYIQVVNSQGDSSVSQDGSNKARERYEKYKEQVKKAKLCYERELREISKYNGVYVENMAFVFEKCQQMELKRMKFFVEMLSGMQKILVDLVSPSKLSQIHNNLELAFNSMGDDQFNQDLKQWSLIHGKDSPQNWPVFEEYVPELHNITIKPAANENAVGVILTKKVIKPENDYNGRHHSIGNITSKEKKAQLHRNISLSTQDVCRSSATTGNGLKDSRDATLFTKQHRVSSFESVQDSTTNSDVPSPPHSVNGDTFLSQSCSYVSAKTSMYKRNDPFTDPFPMPTPERVSNQTNPQNHQNSSHNFPLQPDCCASLNTNTKASIEENSRKVCTENVGTPFSSSSMESTDAAKENLLPDSSNNGFRTNMEGQCNDMITDKPEKVQALYDYNPIEDDELPLVKGEYVEVLRPVDNLGWCYGRKNDKIGFFPAGYVSKI